MTVFERQRFDALIARIRPRAGSSPSRRGNPGGSTAVLTDEQRRSFFELGYAIVPEFWSADEADVVNRAVDLVWSDRSVFNGVTVSAFTSSQRYVETYMRNVPLEARSENYKLNHLYLHSGPVLDLLLSDRVQRVITELLEGTPLLFNGLNMEWGSEQRYHFDTFYMPPHVKDKMAVLWFALEDISDEAGALQYYPRSHLIPQYRFSHGGSLDAASVSAVLATDDEMPAFDRYIEAQLAEWKLESKRFTGRKGDMFIWHSQLYHGGSPIENRRRTRKSMVAHFWRVEDVTLEYCLEVRPGRFIMNPNMMPVPTNFEVTAPDRLFGGRF
jgi:ectoine hydroxylase-related dioxygenase (phytanoyl-CoA dioxygenase family)